ncbi:MAG TPA: sulfotransferase [Solirubrobacterales bacterium]|nr:sulfotransferase [Solirubrobacterales bacterium]
MSSDLVFIGGMGRSGTHALARLLGRHACFADVPIEARFHCDTRGMPGLLGGCVALASFLERLRGFWWHRVRANGQPRGLYNLSTRKAFDAAVERFEDAYASDPVAACRQLFVDLLWPLAAQEEKPGLVEMSSNNVKEAQALRRLFAEARFVHTVRDGRDAAHSVTARAGGPDTVLEGIDWWVGLLRAIEARVRGEEDGAAYALSASELWVVVLDDLIWGDREVAYERLLDFLGIDDDPGMAEFFELRMHPGAARVEPWREGLGRFERRRVERKYEAALAELEREGNHVARPLIDAYERLG